ncbi:unnamed protein product [Symbiodinium sp. CCMP2456]|nr:unnamed protein product [Symbiodinium sp. CCMP2456]
MSAQNASSPLLPGEQSGPNYDSTPTGQAVPIPETGNVQMNGFPPPHRMPQVDVTVPTMDGGLPASIDEDTQAPDSNSVPRSTLGQEATALGQDVLQGVSPASGRATLPAAAFDSAALFPSPLPGASPAMHGTTRSGMEAMTSRAQTWMSRLGDLFQQRRVEVHTAWTHSPTARNMENPWSGNQQPFGALSERDPQREQNRMPPSTGSAPIPYELVQAEVSKQLDGAVNEMYKTMMDRIDAEKQRSEEAERQAHDLRMQLELVERQAQAVATRDYKPEGFEDTFQGGTRGGHIGNNEAINMQGPPPPPGLGRLRELLPVLSAMARGLESLLMSQNSRGDRPETVKPGITELPALPSYTPETGSIDLINWITQKTPIMEDLSDSSSAWWSEMLQEVVHWYSRYSVAAPLERLHLLPVTSRGLSKPEWTRVERRATAMMLTAIPTALKEEVIAAGGVNTLNLLAKLFSTYQPGNRQEKALVLANLEKPSECGDAASAVEALRKWALWRRRVTAIGITEPDSSVLLQGLDRICHMVVKADAELAFRVSLIRSTLQVDVCPTQENVTKFFQHLQAELEQQARLGVVNPRIKALGTVADTGGIVIPPPPPGDVEEARTADTLTSGLVLRSQSVQEGVPTERVISVAIFRSLEYLLLTVQVHAIQPVVNAVEKWCERWNGLEPRKEWLDAVTVNVALAGAIDYDGTRPNVNEQTAYKLIQELEQHDVPRLREATMESVRILKDVEVSWWSCLVDYVVNGDVQSGKESLRRSLFYDEAEREELQKLLLRFPNDGGWQRMKGLGLNRRTRKRLMNASTWIVRWDPAGFARKSDVLQKVGRMFEVAYLNVGSLMAQGGFDATWRLLLWAATQGRIGALLSRDLADTVAEHDAHRVHRARVQFLHSLAAAGMHYKGSHMPRFLVERKRGSKVSSLDWMCDGKAQRYAIEMDLPDPMFAEEEAINVVSGLTGVVYSKGYGRIRLARMSQDAAWRLHVMRNHQPFRRDCALCVRNAATGRQHRATMHPSGYTLSVDLAGPLKGYGRSPDGKFFRNFVLGAFRIPLLDGGVGRDGFVHGHPIPDEDPGEEECLSEEEVEQPEFEEEHDGSSPADLEAEREEWRKLRESFKVPLITETLYFCVPVNSKKIEEVNFVAMQ